MFLKNLSLQNFRNYTKTNFEFPHGTTIIVGPNTVGKTNILEAIFLLASGKSFRADKDIEMVNFTQEIARAGGVVVGEEEQKLEIVLTTGKVGGQITPLKKHLVNGVNKRQMDFAGILKTVLFAPTDLEMITDSPSLRRKYLDFVLIQADRGYRRALSSYEKGLRQRNKLLFRIREEGISRSQLSFWDELLIKNGNVLTQKREEFINFINYQQKTFGKFNLIYDKSEISEERLLKYTREEVASATTLVGPHRDDWKIKKKKGINELKNLRIKELDNQGEELDISLFGSRGEQRMAVLWLKFCELDFVREKSGIKPVLLLDDIFSELDEDHRRLIMEIIPKQQTIITTTDLDHVGKEFLGKIKVIELK